MSRLTKREVLDKIPNDSDRHLGVNFFYILTKLKIDSKNVRMEDLDRLKACVSSLRTRRNEKFNAASRKADKFELKNSAWLNSEFHLPELCVEKKIGKSCLCESSAGRRPLEFQKKSERSQRREAAKISTQNEHDPSRIILACKHAARKSGEKDLHAVLKEVFKSPHRLSKVRKLLDTSTSVIKKKNPNEALSFLLDNSLTKNVYINMRIETKSCGADIWPLYNDVRDAKAQCRPPKEVVMISETAAEVPLQSLLNHTVQRIVNLQEEVIHQSMSSTDLTEVDVVLTCSWGFDGNTSHSVYKQRYQNEQAEAVNDENLFVTTLIPLRLSSSTGIIFWNNRMTQSARFCRPLKLEYVKECSNVIMRQKQLIEDQINQLKIFEISLNDYRIRVHFSLLLTLIDGKVLNIITGTKSMQTCPICQATPNKFNDLSNRLKGLFLPDPNSL